MDFFKYGFLVFNVFHVGMSHEHCTPFLAERMPVGAITHGVQIDEQPHERSYWSMLEWITCCDIDMFQFWRKTMNDCWQQVFIGQYNGRAASVINTSVLFEPCTDIACLYVFSRSTEIGNVLGLFEVSVNLLVGNVKFVREILQILTNICACLVLDSMLISHVVIIEIPIEARFSMFL